MSLEKNERSRRVVERSKPEYAMRALARSYATYHCRQEHPTITEGELKAKIEKRVALLFS